MPTKKKTRTRTEKDFDVMTVAQVMQKQVQAVHLKTKGDVVALLMVEGFGAVGWWMPKISSWASSANMICWPPWMMDTSLVRLPRATS